MLLLRNETDSGNRYRVLLNRDYKSTALLCFANVYDANAVTVLDRLGQSFICLSLHLISMMSTKKKPSFIAS